MRPNPILIIHPT